MRDDAHSSAQTRQRLLDAAGEVFADKGFRAATTREICGRAGANVAAIHYHFGDKEGLYEAVLRYAHRHTDGAAPGAGGTAPERLEAFVEWFLLRILGQGRPAWQSKLLTQEILEPTRAFDSLVHDEFKPVATLAESLCAELLGSGAAEGQARLAARSLIAQCVYYRFAQPVLARLYGEESFGPERARELARHIAEFSLGGLARLAEGRTRSETPSARRKRRA